MNPILRVKKPFVAIFFCLILSYIKVASNLLLLYKPNLVVIWTLDIELGDLSFRQIAIILTFKVNLSTRYIDIMLKAVFVILELDHGSKLRQTVQLSRSTTKTIFYHFRW